MANLIGHKATSDLCLRGKFASAEQALGLGLADKIVDSPNDLLPTAFELLKPWLALRDEGRILTQDNLRGEVARAWSDENRLRQNALAAWAQLNQPASIAAFDKMFAAIGSKGKGAKI